MKQIKTDKRMVRKGFQDRNRGKKITITNNNRKCEQINSEVIGNWLILNQKVYNFDKK